NLPQRVRPSRDEAPVTASAVWSRRVRTRGHTGLVMVRGTDGRNGALVGFRSRVAVWTPEAPDERTISNRGVVTYPTVGANGGGRRCQSVRIPWLTWHSRPNTLYSRTQNSGRSPRSLGRTVGSRWSVTTSPPATSPRPSTNSNAGSKRAKSTSFSSAPPVRASPRPRRG